MPHDRDRQTHGLTSQEALQLLSEEAAAERALAQDGDPDPCRWFTPTMRWLHLVTSRPDDPLPILIRGQRGRSHRFDPAAVREWFAAEFERRSAAKPVDMVSGEESGLLVTAHAFAREMRKEPQTFVRRMREWGIQPARTIGKKTYYRVFDFVQAMLGELRTDNPDAMPPVERDAHYRAETRKDALRLSRRELVRYDDAVRTTNALAALLRDAIELIPDALESRCGIGPEALAVVELELDKLRVEIAENVEKMASSLGSGS